MTMRLAQIKKRQKKHHILGRHSQKVSATDTPVYTYMNRKKTGRSREMWDCGHAVEDDSRSGRGAPQVLAHTMDGEMEAFKDGGMVGRRARLPSERTIGLTTGGWEEEGEEEEDEEEEDEDEEESAGFKERQQRSAPEKHTQLGVCVCLCARVCLCLRTALLKPLLATFKLILSEATGG